MGTSASSKGPGAGVSFDPPWLDDDGGFETKAPSLTSEEENGDAIDGEKVDPSIAPSRRFFGARSSLRDYASKKSGRSGFQKAAGNYSKTGMGGAGRLASRMRHSTAAGARLAEFLTSTSSQSNSEVKTWVKEIVDRGLRGRELIDAIIRNVAPSSGSRDEESCSDSMARALSEFLEKNNQADLLALGVDEIREITEHYLANEACNRLVNDIGQILESGKLSLKDTLSLLTEMREFLRADLSVQMNRLWRTVANPTHVQLNQILRSAVERTFEVYESEV